MLRLALLMICVSFTAAGQPPAVRFRNVAESAGVHFSVHNSPTPQKLLYETMAGGLAIFDYNNDGRPDIFFTNGAAHPSMKKTGPEYWNRLYRNDGGMKFTDVTEAAGLAGEGYSIAVAAADFDNDGNVDLFVGGVGTNTLYRNLGNGKFQDVSTSAGVRDNLWTAAATWFDYDRDGHLDLWIAHYVVWPAEEGRFCGDLERKIRVYCHPKYFKGLPNRLYRNLGGGKFEDVSEKAGLNKFPGRGMGVVAADYDGDGWEDVFVTNDKEPNSLFRNTGNSRFEEVGLTAGSALKDSGIVISSMGAEFRDYDGDGFPDIFVVALAGETFPVFRNNGKGGFVDATYSSGVARASTKRSGWGVGLFDLNLDGWRDLFVTCAHVNDEIEKFEPNAYRLPNAIFLNEKGQFRDVSAEAGPDFQKPQAHRGLGFADLNGDGKIDVVTSSLMEPAEIWENITETDGDWLIVKLQGVKANRDGIGAKVRWGGQWNTMSTSMGYASSSHFGIHFGAPKDKVGDTVEVIWPGGKKQTVTGVKPRRVLLIKEE